MTTETLRAIDQKDGKIAALLVIPVLYTLFECVSQQLNRVGEPPIQIEEQLVILKSFIRARTLFDQVGQRPVPEHVRPRRFATVHLGVELRLLGGLLSGHLAQLLGLGGGTLGVLLVVVFIVVLGVGGIFAVGVFVLKKEMI